MKKMIYFVALVLIVGTSFGVYMFFKKPLDTREARPEYQLTAEELVKLFTENEDAANKKYLDKIILVTGKVSEIKLEGNSATVFLDSGDPMSGITCSFYSDEASKLSAIKLDETVSIKGKCTGKLMDVVLNNCSISTKSN